VHEVGVCCEHSGHWNVVEFSAPLKCCMLQCAFPVAGQHGCVSCCDVVPITFSLKLALFPLQEERLRRGDDLRLQMALEESRRDTVKVPKKKEVRLAGRYLRLSCGYCHKAPTSWVRHTIGSPSSTSNLQTCDGQQGDIRTERRYLGASSVKHSSVCLLWLWEPLSKLNDSALDLSWARGSPWYCWSSVPAPSSSAKLSA
jgi:hypothetical protein